MNLYIDTHLDDIAILLFKDNKIVKSAKDLKTGDKINVRFVDGERQATVL